MVRMAAWIVVPSLCLTALTACGGSDRNETLPAPAPDETTSSAPSQSPGETPSIKASPQRSARPKVIGTIAEGLEVPWGVAFLPDGSALVTERDSGQVLQVRRGSVHQVGVIDVQPDGEAGLLGVAVSPTYARDKRVFFYATAADDNRVLRTTFD